MCILTFGVLMLAQGFGRAPFSTEVAIGILTAIVQNYGGILATRFLLGVAEAGIFPGSMF